MAEWVQGNWILVVVAAVLLAVLAWWVLVVTRRTRVIIAPDGGASAKRNQALIDAPAAAAFAEVPPATPEGLAGVGVAVEVAADLVPVVPAGGDDLTRIKGLGPKLAGQLHELGVTSYAQIAGWDEAEIDRIDAQLGRFEGRIRRDDWQAQARLLAAGDDVGYEAQFGRL